MILGDGALSYDRKGISTRKEDASRNAAVHLRSTITISW
jgi:hypothetical protein